MSPSSRSVPLQKRRRISWFCALFSTKNPACLVSKLSARTRPSRPAVFLDSSLKLSLQSCCIAVSSLCARASRGKFVRKFHFHVCLVCLFIFSIHCFIFKRIVETEILRLFCSGTEQELCDMFAFLLRAYFIVYGF